MKKEKREKGIIDHLIDALYILAILLLVWVLASFCETLPFIEEKELSWWNFFKFLLKLSEHLYN